MHGYGEKKKEMTQKLDFADPSQHRRFDRRLSCERGKAKVPSIASREMPRVGRNENSSSVRTPTTIEELEKQFGYRYIYIYHFLSDKQESRSRGVRRSRLWHVPRIRSQWWLLDRVESRFLMTSFCRKPFGSGLKTARLAFRFTLNPL